MTSHHLASLNAIFKGVDGSPPEWVIPGLAGCTCFAVCEIQGPWRPLGLLPVVVQCRQSDPASKRCRSWLILGMSSANNRSPSGFLHGDSADPSMVEPVVRCSSSKIGLLGGFLCQWCRDLWETPRQASPGKQQLH